jgi:hypothetical protein
MNKAVGLKSLRNPAWYKDGKRIKGSNKQEPQTGSMRGKLKTKKES